MQIQKTVCGQKQKWLPFPNSSLNNKKLKNYFEPSKHKGINPPITIFSEMVKKPDFFLDHSVWIDPQCLERGWSA